MIRLQIQCPERFLDIISQNHSASKSNQLHGCDLLVFFSLIRGMFHFLFLK